MRGKPLCTGRYSECYDEKRQYEGFKGGARRGPLRGGEALTVAQHHSTRTCAASVRWSRTRRDNAGDPGTRAGGGGGY